MHSLPIYNFLDGPLHHVHGLCSVSASPEPLAMSVRSVMETLICVVVADANGYHHMSFFDGFPMWLHSFVFVHVFLCSSRATDRDCPWFLSLVMLSSLEITLVVCIKSMEPDSSRNSLVPGLMGWQSRLVVLMDVREMTSTGVPILTQWLALELII